MLFGIYDFNFGYICFLFLGVMELLDIVRFIRIIMDVMDLRREIWISRYWLN